MSTYNYISSSQLGYKLISNNMGASVYKVL